jgi:hypothetical protein
MKTLPAAALKPLLLLVACLAFASRAKALTSFAESGRKPVVRAIHIEGASFMSSRGRMTAAGGGATTGFREDGLHLW